MSTKIMGAMPKGEHNGLADAAEKIREHSGDLVYLVVVAEVAKVGEVVSSGEATAELRMVDVEIAGEESVRALLRESRKNRTGSEELDLSALDGDDDE